MKWSKRFTSVLFVLLAISLGFLLFVIFQSYQPEQSGNEIQDDQREMVRLNKPRSGQTISSPLRVEGEARGMWYFEGSFPIKLLSEDERVIAEHYVTADGKWMTDEFVPFTAELPFSQREGGNGWLVLERSNPSGRPENAHELRIPIEFPGEEAMQVSVYFNKKEVAECENTVAVYRTIARTEARARAALENLFAGTTWKEQQEGYMSSIPQGVVIERLTIQDGTAKLELNENVDKGVAGSCWVRSIRSQIENTLLQFSTVDSVIISVNGRTDEVLQP